MDPWKGGVKHSTKWAFFDASLFLPSSETEVGPRSSSWPWPAGFITVPSALSSPSVLARVERRTILSPPIEIVSSKHVCDTLEFSIFP